MYLHRCYSEADSTGAVLGTEPLIIITRLIPRLILQTKSITCSRLWHCPCRPSDQDDLYCDPSWGPHADLKSATTAAGSPRALPLWCGPERITYFSVQN